MQNLGCGVFEVTKKDPDADSDDSDDDEGLKQLQIPSAQTAGMAAAQRAGRVLVQEVESSDAGAEAGEAEEQRAGSAIDAEGRDSASPSSFVESAVLKEASVAAEPLAEPRAGARSSARQSSKRAKVE